MTFDYDLFVIGGGSGGVRAARLASSEAGARVGLAEEYRMGGTCVIRGCVPKKLMVFASGYSSVVDDARNFGWELSTGPFQWETFAGHMNRELDRLEAAYRNTLAKAGVEVFDARAVLEDAHTVRLSTGERFSARHILVCTGGRPVLPPIEGAEYGITSNDIFLMPHMPKRMLIVGGGYIASEFACIMNGLGTEVTQFYRGEQILRGFDTETALFVQEQIVERGVNLRLNTNVTRLEKLDDGRVRAHATDGTAEEYDQVFFATGRHPNTENMGLEELGVALGKRGEILVDEFSQTGVPSVYAVGDVTGRIDLTPVAIREGAAFVETVFHGRPTPVDHALVPSAVFTQPEMGTVGLTEEEAAEHGPVEVYTTRFKPMHRAFAGRSDRVLMKLLVQKDTRKVLGCHIVADQAGEMIQLVGIAVKMGATKEEFDRTCAVHPTMAEELVTMKAPTRTI
ncbi:glutathione-disulfide reductase [Brevirhabdus pacifica]|uniref:Glutathione-disulfide reductase n=1 Tax=Brevirhabdus pacifica TaxID=1267768 RepID=A0A1U7DHG0_9RHOB|nr:glutathione-disulfide reductase [Brevirhabdus pacifica]APX89318.1 glutathione-disulfide reductase [Brevirhabdus pacifica]OWU76654.1 NADPH-glutathione reductase [Loktanella sp. 22II-4b]PJJ86060.1 NADPH-glutathione reductase [Brevirhabdus pacifica]